MTRAAPRQAHMGSFFCTLLMLVTGLMLLVGWTSGFRSVEQSSVAIVFASALIGRCILVLER